MILLIFFSALYLDEFIKVAKRELGWEVDYIREAENTKRFKKLLENMPDYKVPSVVGKKTHEMYCEFLTNWFWNRWAVLEADLYHRICWRDLYGTGHGIRSRDEKSCCQKDSFPVSLWAVWIPFHANWSKLGQLYVWPVNPTSKFT